MLFRLTGDAWVLALSLLGLVVSAVVLTWVAVRFLS